MHQFLPALILPRYSTKLEQAKKQAVLLKHRPDDLFFVL
jgi:hypothetical protein